LLTIACVFKESATYKREHVTRLRKMLIGRVNEPFQFVCVESELPGWWGKIDLFKPGRFNGRVLYLDLDVTLVSDLRQIIHYPSRFSGIRDWLNKGINSSVMVWDSGVADHLYTNFMKRNAMDIMSKYMGDQDWINDNVIADKFPKEWCPSYKYNIRETGVIPDTAKIIVFHGEPKPWDINVSTR